MTWKTQKRLQGGLPQGICMRDYMFIGRMGAVEGLFYLFLLHEICSIPCSFFWIS
ncbi:hypothetical protein M441DRAFT_244100 [Trichoderma asperellum CBS 433.97]|uniref:Uncharacterized protein n=1 Tax=Trichoderma asperellum (strain ATCC 204424 / CBS 433.97 / NBRC 101777) TaxID=1042311 RepID=A0A2T3Z2Q1_TRIA4|nr:hypothetical protein M441DRAFT_244100 [Trichoderma asperellum CBS 433.97]PTB39075.1 hypothetical protein M441DRAFT_244100 [Trichoderma asperellum CBS 433.97]